MSGEQTGRFFINYRRDDSFGVAGRLGDTLTAYFGDGRVFRDTSDIQAGADFAHVLDETVGNADAVIVLIGRDWLAMTDSHGRRRLDDPEDWVAREIAAALTKELPVFPVLIGDTPMPRAEELPESLRPLVRHNAIAVSDSRWESDVTRLAKAIAFDIPGSAAERKLDRIRLLATLPLLTVVVATTGVLAWNLHSGLAPLKFWQSGVSYVAVILSAVLLLVFAGLMDTTRRRYAQAAGIVGLAGAFIFYVLVAPLDAADELLALYFGSTSLAMVMLVLMTLSGFKPK